MNTFGNIKTNIEKTAVELTKDPKFKKFIFEFNSLVLKNKDICELYHIYDDLSTSKGLSTDIVNDYINESVEYSQILIESQTKNIDYLSSWISSWNKSTENNYSDIDNSIYNTSIRNLESVLESKKNIKKTLLSENKVSEIKEGVNLPLKTMLGIANKTISKQLSNLSEEDKKELQSITTLSKDDIKDEINSLKEEVSSKLKLNLNESTDSELTNAIQSTIDKVNDAKCDHYNLYKLRKLNMGL